MNKKVKNATETIFNGIKFKSKLEKTTYIALKQLNLDVVYEPEKIVLWTGHKPIKPLIYFNHGELIEDTKKLRDITWEYDFLVTNKKGNTYIVESKGFQNDTFPRTLKMFRGLLDNLNFKAVFLVKSKKEAELTAQYILNN